jgi:hypothetical protein
MYTPFSGSMRAYCAVSRTRIFPPMPISIHEQAGRGECKRGPVRFVSVYGRHLKDVMLPLCASSLLVKPSN